jgi:redox-sensitive bicupin YhaK (pirin superfamily)
MREVEPQKEKGVHMVGIHESTSPTAHHTRRTIVRRTRGSRHGAITRLMSPSDVGQVLKPFVFLDLFDLRGASSGMGLHPHSGIATVSYVFEGSVRYEDSNGATGVLPAGTHGGATSLLKATASLNYLAVCLRAGESWRYQPALDHTVGWISLSVGRVRVPEIVEAGELASFEPSNEAIDIHAEAETEFVLGSAAPHAHDLVLGPYSVHTSSGTLRAGERRLTEIQQRLQSEGRL